ncbi:MAG: hypothetical protein LBK54_02340 [Propionibacteriaceae bacterium]|nr:hypothetical protein [Propionibacteriaceae bacterium]
MAERLVEYCAPYTFQTKGDARAWLDQEQELISSGEWTPPAERIIEARRDEEARRNALTIATFGTAYVESRPSAGTRSRYRQLLSFYILDEPLPSKKKDGKPKVYTTIRTTGTTPSANSRPTAAITASPSSSHAWTRFGSLDRAKPTLSCLSQEGTP